MSRDAHSYDIRVEEGKGREYVIRLGGRIALENFNSLASQIDPLIRDHKPAKIIVDLTGIQYLDSAGALLLVKARGEARKASIPFQFDNMNEEVDRMVRLIDGHVHAIRAPSQAGPRGDLSQRIQGFIEKHADRFTQLMNFTGETVMAAVNAFFHPRSVRWDAVLFYMRRAGVDGLPIVGLIGILLGLIMAFMASLQLKLFGANIYVASLVGIALIKELGPIMTAILFAGRSGSAFAAEIGTMMVNEEVDALVTMGFDPIKFLVIPKVLAAVLVVPLLTIYAVFLGIIGGLIVGVLGLDLTFYAYVQQTMKTMKIFDIVTSLIKSVCFATLIGGIVCHRGFQVRGGAEAVGAAATSAVVSAIFLIIVADSAFAIMLHYIQ